MPNVHEETTRLLGQDAGESMHRGDGLVTTGTGTGTGAGTGAGAGTGTGTGTGAERAVSDRPTSTMRGTTVGTHPR